MNGSTNKSLLALLVGATIGVGLGILFAPDKGEATRKKIKDNFDDLKDDSKEKWSEFEEGAKNKYATTKTNVKDALDDILSNSSYKAEEAIVFLEEKLAELKKQNAKFQK